MAFLTLRNCGSIVGLIAASAFVFACATPAAKKKSAPLEFTDDNSATDPITVDDDEGFPIDPDRYNEDSGAFGAGERPAPDAGGGGNRGGEDAGPIKPPQDGGGTTPPPTTYCNTTGVPVAGDLAIVEIMISSKAGSGDSGEWVEIQNTHTDCWLKVKGLSVESPRGAAAPNLAKIEDDFELAPNGTFVVADSSDPTKNHAITGKVISWESTDVLKNDGDSIHVKLGTVQIDSITYPAFTNLTSGRALSFPNDCAWSDRSAWARWSLTFTDYSAGFKGTPNGVNTDVACF